jgi:hypothetical protein
MAKGVRTSGKSKRAKKRVVMALDPKIFNYVNKQAEKNGVSFAEAARKFIAKGIRAYIKEQTGKDVLQDEND